MITLMAGRLTLLYCTRIDQIRQRPHRYYPRYLRNAANMIVSMRAAGNFGCFNMFTPASADSDKAQMNGALKQLAIWRNEKRLVTGHKTRHVWRIIN